MVHLNHLFRLSSLKHLEEKSENRKWRELPFDQDLVIWIVLAYCSLWTHGGIHENLLHYLCCFKNVIPLWYLHSLPLHSQHTSQHTFVLKEHWGNIHIFHLTLTYTLSFTILQFIQLVSQSDVRAFSSSL